MYKDLLPIGSVVALQGATRKLLIIGTIVHDEQTNTTYLLDLHFPRSAAYCHGTGSA